MSTYEVESDDLVTVADQLHTQSDQCGRTSDGVQQFTTIMLTDVRAAAASAETTVIGLLDELSRVVSAATASATVADWTGSDADRFREANENVSELIARSRQQVNVAFAERLAAADQVAQVLSGMMTDSTAAVMRAGQLSAELSAAVRAEADQYAEAFAGGLGAVAGIGVGVAADATLPDSGPDAAARRLFGHLQDEIVGIANGAAEEIEGVAKGAVEKVLQAGDNVPELGANRLNSDFEDQLLRRWLAGSGETYELTPDQMATVTNSPIVQHVGAAIVNNETPTNFRGDTIHVQGVTLANGQRGYAASVDFYGPLSGDQVNTLDGSFGGATVYYNDRGEAVGIRDRYDFTNDSIQVDMTNFAGSLVGAKDYDIRGGVTER